MEPGGKGATSRFIVLFWSRATPAALIARTLELGKRPAQCPQDPECARIVLVCRYELPGNRWEPRRRLSTSSQGLSATAVTAGSQRPPNNGFPSLKLFSFGLQSITRHVLPLSPGWEPGTSLGFGPFSAIITGRDDTRLPVSSLPVHRFSQPLNRSFVPHDSWVYSTPQALLGS
jgi:hypothetical protein